MNQPAWLNFVPASYRQDYAAELNELVKFAENAASEGDTKLEEAIFAAGRIPAPEDFVRPFRALVIAVDACRHSNAQSDESVFLGTIGRWLRRNIPLARTDLADLLRVVGGLPDAKQQGALLGSVLSTFKRVLGASALTADERSALQAIAANLAQSKLPKSTIAKLRADIDVICDDSTAARLHPDDGWADQLCVGGRSGRRGGFAVGRIPQCPGRSLSGAASHGLDGPPPRDGYRSAPRPGGGA